MKRRWGEYEDFRISGIQDFKIFGRILRMEERRYQRLVAWQEAYALCLDIYRLSKKFPSEEKFALTSQLRRAASSVVLNTAEGNAKRSSKEKIRFFETALASLDEVHCVCLLAKDLSYCDDEDLVRIGKSIEYVSVLLTKLRASFQS
jgi:four helix bundle protein